MPITEVISFAFAGLWLRERVFDPELDLMQSSFMAQVEGTYVGHIRTRRELQKFEFKGGSYRGNELLAHLWYAFLGQFLLEPSANVDQKEERVERSAGAETGAVMGGAGLHAGAGAEDPQNVSHSVSVGAGPYQRVIRP